MQKLSDKELFEGIKDRNEEVIRYLIKSYFPKVKRFVLNNKGNVSDAEDVLQETLVIVFEKLKSDGLNINCQFGTYLVGISKIVWIKELKKIFKTEKIELNTDLMRMEAEVVKNLEKRDRQNIYKEYFNKLDEECRKLLSLFFSSKKIKEITAEMNYKTDQHTKNKKYICKKHLIKAIRSNPKFKEVKNERLNNISEIPRW